jgi:hypothetical protein
MCTENLVRIDLMKESLNVGHCRRNAVLPVRHGQGPRPIDLVERKLVSIVEVAD